MFVIVKGWRMCMISRLFGQHFCRFCFFLWHWIFTGVYRNPQVVGWCVCLHQNLLSKLFPKLFKLVHLVYITCRCSQHVFSFYNMVQFLWSYEPMEMNVLRGYWIIFSDSSSVSWNCCVPHSRCLKHEQLLLC